MFGLCLSYLQQQVFLRQAKRSHCFAHTLVSATCLSIDLTIIEMCFPILPGRAHMQAYSALELATICKHPPAPQEQSFALTRRRHSLSAARKNSLTFCPRVFPQNRHFSQESAPQRAKIRALLWAYARPERAQRITHMQAYSALELATICKHPPAPQEQSFALTRRRHSKQRSDHIYSSPLLGQILSESFRWFTKDSLVNPCFRLDLCGPPRREVRKRASRCTCLPPAYSKHPPRRRHSLSPARKTLWHSVREFSA
jgi:hypothetical protein